MPAEGLSLEESSLHPLQKRAHRLNRNFFQCFFIISFVYRLIEPFFRLFLQALVNPFLGFLHLVFVDRLEFFVQGGLVRFPLFLHLQELGVFFARPDGAVNAFFYRISNDGRSAVKRHELVEFHTQVFKARRRFCQGLLDGVDLVCGIVLGRFLFPEFGIVCTVIVGEIRYTGIHRETFDVNGIGRLYTIKKAGDEFAAGT